MAYGFSFGSAGRYGRRNYNKELTPAGRVFMALIAIAFVIMPFVEFDRYKGLAENGREALAKVISYNPTYTHNKHGTTTHHWHILSYEGSQKRVELHRHIAPGAVISIVYDPAKPSFTAEGKKGMSGAELMGSGYQWMWFMVLFGVAMILLAFFAPSKPGTGITFGASSSTGALPESLAGLTVKSETKTYISKALEPDAGNEPVNRITSNRADTFTPAIETAIPFIAGGPKEAEKAPAAGNAFSKFGFEVMDEGHRLFKEHAEFAAAALAEKFGHLTIGQAKEVIAKADALDYAAEDEANNVQGGLYTAEKAAANLMKTNPGFSEALYKGIIKEKIKLL